MSFDKRKILQIIREQLALEYNCAPDDFIGQGHIITSVSNNENRRRFSDKPNLFKMATFGGNVVISADEKLHPFLQEFTTGKLGHWLFEFPNLKIIDRKLSEFGAVVSQTAHMFLPKPETDIPVIRYPVKWFEQNEIHQFYAGKPYPNALCERFKPERPDVLAVAAYDGDKIIGMAGCSADTPLLWQIGIDVDEAYRGKQIGTGLVALLKAEILRRGKVPYYGTSLSNYYSWGIALSAGFFPAWVEAVSKDEA